MAKYTRRGSESLFKAAAVGLLSISVVACQGGSGPGEIPLSQALFAPNAPPGDLCYTRGRIPEDVAFDASSGLARVTAFRSRAVLGGSELDQAGTLATRLRFKVNGFSDSIDHGSRQEVCVEAGARHACDRLSACWRSDGSWVVDQMAAPTCRPDTTPQIAVLAPSTLATTLAPLQRDGSEYAILLEGQAGSYTVRFFRNDAQLVQVPFTTANPPTEGMSAYRAERIALDVQLTGLSAQANTLVSRGIVREGITLASGETLSCSLLRAPPANLRTAFPKSDREARRRRKVGVKWDPPRGQTTTVVYKDGRLLQSLVAGGETTDSYTTFDEANQTAYVEHDTVGRAHEFQVYFISNSDGTYGEPAILDVDLDPLPDFGPPSAPGDTDGKINVGLLLARYADVPAPFPADRMRRKVFDTSEGAYTWANYFNGLTGRSVFQGDLLTGTGVDPDGWLVLRDAAGQPLNRATGGHGADLNTQMAWAGIPYQAYDRVLSFFGGDDSYFGTAGAAYLDPDGLPDLAIHLHEFGHSLSFGHSYGGRCPQADLMTVLDDDCDAIGGARASTGLPFVFDGMSSLPTTPKLWHTLHQQFLGLLTPAEIGYHREGTRDATYAIRAIGDPRTVVPLRQVQVEIAPNVFYFAEYRKNVGFDGPYPWPLSLVPVIRFFHQDSTGVAVWLSAPRWEGNWQRIYAVADRMKPGDRYCDPSRGIEIKVNSLDDGAATIAVSRGACTPPALALQVQALTDRALPFGETQTGKCTAGKTSTIRNVSPDVSGLMTVTLTGQGAAAFRITEDGCNGQRISSGRTCVVTVAACPTTGGDHEATLEIRHGTDIVSRPLSVHSTSPTVVEPNLARRSGHLCFSREGNNGDIVGRDSSPFPWWEVTSYRSQAVLGGSYVVPTAYTKASTDVAFKVTGFSEGAANGSARQVCADLAVQNASNSLSACWHADGTWAIETSVAVSSYPDALQRAVIRESGELKRIPQLTADDSMYRIHVFVGRDSSAATFLKNEFPVGVANFVPPVAPVAGFSGFHADGTRLKLRVGSDAYYHGQIGSESVGYPGDTGPDGQPLQCDYQLVP